MSHRPATHYICDGCKKETHTDNMVTKNPIAAMMGGPTSQSTLPPGWSIMNLTQAFHGSDNGDEPTVDSYQELQAEYLACSRICADKVFRDKYGMLEAQIAAPKKEQMVSDEEIDQLKEAGFI